MRRYLAIEFSLQSASSLPSEHSTKPSQGVLRMFIPGCLALEHFKLPNGETSLAPTHLSKQISTLSSSEKGHWGWPSHLRSGWRQRPERGHWK